MANLTIKNVPETLVERLKRQAEAHRRSLNLEVIACLEGATQSVAVDPDALLARVRAVRKAPTRGPLTDTALARLKSQGRP